MTAHKHKRVQITGVPVGALSRLGKGANADQKLENKFSGRLNKFHDACPEQILHLIYLGVCWEMMVADSLSH